MNHKALTKFSRLFSWTIRRVTVSTTTPGRIFPLRRMSAEKRRLARLQGGVNRGKQPNEQRVPHQSKSSNLRRSLDSQMPSSNLPTTEPNPRLGNSFTYEETKQEIKEEPKEIIIETEGKHILSTEPSGESVIYFYPDFLDDEVQNDLFETLLKEIKWHQSYVLIQGEYCKCPRLVKWFGPSSYGYSGTLLEADNEWHPIVQFIHNSVTQKIGAEFNSVLLNLYRDEHDSVAWHSDDELSMGILPKIASVSLGATRIFKLRKKPSREEYENYGFRYVQYCKVPLTSGSLLVMDGHTQADWQHSVQKEYHSRKPRINLTFRTICDSVEHTKRKPYV